MKRDNRAIFKFIRKPLSKTEKEKIKTFIGLVAINDKQPELITRAKAYIKFLVLVDGGRGALLCSKCSVIIKTGSSFSYIEKMASMGECKLRPQYCEQCEDLYNTQKDANTYCDTDRGSSSGNTSSISA